MAYDADLADEIRAVLSERTPFEERKMFGGLGFMVNGNILAAANNAGELMVRVSKETGDELAATTAATPMVMGGRTMRGWVEVPTATLTTSAAVAEWVDRALAFNATLPAKTPKRRGTQAPQ